jgi:hypothetical protein
MEAQNGIRVLKAVAPTENHATIRPEVPDRDFLIDLRRALLQQLAVIEKRLNTQRHCRRCGADFDLFIK